MLVSFSVSNFRSFGEEVTLTMVASNRLEAHPGHRIEIDATGKHLLRCAVVYGANAAGKSNLVKAMKFAQQLIVSTDGVPATQPFRFLKEFADKPSSFEFRFLLDERVFIYGFDIRAQQIEAEWLAVKRGDEEVEIFDRDAGGNTDLGETARRMFLAEDSTMFKTMQVLKSLPLTKHQFFLNRASSLPEANQGKTLSSIIRWLTEDLLILGANYRATDILDRIESDGRFRAFSKGFLQSVGTGVADLHISRAERPATEFERMYYSHFRTGSRANHASADHSDSTPKADDPGRMIVRTLFAGHGAGMSAPFLPFAEESDGTQQLLHLMPVLCNPPGRSKVVVIDELDRSLHPLICWEFIRFFSESSPGAHRQLIVTTHEAHLLNQDLLRRDEYWFVEKDKFQQSRLTSLVEFKIRADLQVEKGYLQGRFGAIPIIGSMEALERLLECEQFLEPGDAAQESTT